MAKKKLTLDTPFKRGEKVMLVHSIPGRSEGERGKVTLVSGFDTWKRYWVRFADGDHVGSVDHADLVRPRMFAQWREHQEAEAKARLAAQQGAAESAMTTADAGGGGGGGGIADQIPAHLLERSKAAKARLTAG